jgi:putative tricarboxylic transport membrane protein
VKANNADLWSGLALGALGAYIITEAWRWEYLGADGPGPGFLPLWYGIAIVALSAALVVLSIAKRSPDRIDWAGAGRALTIWAAFAAAAAALKWAGFVVCFATLSFFIVAVMYRRPLKVAAAVAIAVTAGFYLVFPLALGVKLP